MDITNTSHTRSNVTWVKKVRTGTLTLRCPLKNKLGRQETIYIVEWNVRALLNRSKRPERQMALLAKELKRYNINIAALCETRLANHGSLVDKSYTFFWSGRKKTKNTRQVSASQ